LRTNYMGNVFITTYIMTKLTEQEIQALREAEQKT